MAFFKIVCTICDTKTGLGQELSEAIQDLYRRRTLRQLKSFNWLEKRLDNTGRHSAHTKANRSECVKGLWRPSYSVGHIIFSLDGLWLNRYEETVPSLFSSLSHTMHLVLISYSWCAKPHYYSADPHNSCVFGSLLLFLEAYDAAERDFCHVRAIV